MTITTEVRINWPVPAEALLDHVTRHAGGDPATVKQRRTAAGEPAYPDWMPEWLAVGHEVANLAGQGLRTLADVTWAEHPEVFDPTVRYPDDEQEPCPPALVILSIDNPYGGGPLSGSSGIDVQAFDILPAVRDWLDERGVPREAWCWEDESAGSWHPGTTPVEALADRTIEREVWQPQEVAR